MTEISRYWGGIVTGDSGPYGFDQFTDVWADLFMGSIATAGPIKGRGNELAATGAVSPVAIDTGSALVDGTYYNNSASVNITIPVPSVSTRIDRIVLEKDWTAQTIRLTRVAGVEGGGVPALTQVDGATWQISLTQVSITTGGAITLTDERVYIFPPDWFASLHDHSGDAGDGGTITHDISEISDTSPSGVASVDISSIPATGGDLIIEGFLQPALDGPVFYLRLNNYSGASDYRYTLVGLMEGGGGTDTFSSGAAQIPVSSRAIGNAASEGASFSIRIPNYSQLISGEYIYIIWACSNANGSGQSQSFFGAGILQKAEVVNRVTLLFSSGNIANGRVRIYTIGN